MLLKLCLLVIDHRLGDLEIKGGCPEGLDHGCGTDLALRECFGDTRDMRLLLARHAPNVLDLASQPRFQGLLVLGAHARKPLMPLDGLCDLRVLLMDSVNLAVEHVHVVVQ